LIHDCLEKTMKDNKVQSVEDQVLGASSSAQLTAPLRARVTDEALEGLNRMEAFFAGQGYRQVNRSHLVRIAVDRFVRDITEEHPEIREIVIQMRS